MLNNKDILDTLYILDKKDIQQKPPGSHILQFSIRHCEIEVHARNLLKIYPILHINCSSFVEFFRKKYSKKIWEKLKLVSRMDIRVWAVLKCNPKNEC